MGSGNGVRMPRQDQIDRVCLVPRPRHQSVGRSLFAGGKQGVNPLVTLLDSRRQHHAAEVGGVPGRRPRRPGIAFLPRKIPTGPTAPTARKGLVASAFLLTPLLAPVVDRGCSVWSMNAEVVDGRDVILTVSVL